MMPFVHQAGYNKSTIETQRVWIADRGCGLPPQLLDQPPEVLNALEDTVWRLRMALEMAERALWLGEP